MGNSILKVCNVKKKYKKNFVLDNVSFEIEQGEIFGILGKNGAGKSTLIRIISNLITPTSGNVLFLNNPTKKSLFSAENIGVLLEGGKNIYHYLSIEDNLYYFSYLNKINKKEIEEKKEELLNMFDLKGKEKEVVSKLSRGMQQKVSLMILLLKDPEILILDEPTLGLDIISVIQFKNFLSDLAKKINKTIILCSHDVNFMVDLCDKIMILKDGKIIYNNSKNDLMSKCENTYNIYLNIDDSSKVNKYQHEVLDNGLYVIRSNNLIEIIKEFHENEIISIEHEKSDVENVIKRMYEGGK